MEPTTPLARPSRHRLRLANEKAAARATLQSPRSTPVVTRDITRRRRLAIGLSHGQADGTRANGTERKCPAAASTQPLRPVQIARWLTGKSMQATEQPQRAIIIKSHRTLDFSFDELYLRHLQDFSTNAFSNPLLPDIDKYPFERLYFRFVPLLPNISFGWYDTPSAFSVALFRPNTCLHHWTHGYGY